MIPIPARSALLVGCLLLAVGVGAAPARADAAPVAFRQAVAEAIAGDEAAAFYRERGFAPFWTVPGEAGEARVAALLGALTQAHEHGLPSGRWDVAALRDRLGQARSSAEVGAAEAEITRVFLDYATALTSGLLDPKSIAPSMVREVPRPDRAALLRRMEREDPAGVLRTLVPTASEYGRLMRHRARLERVVASGGWGPDVAAGILRPGDAGPEVVRLRERLRAMGLAGPSLSPLYDEALTAAVVAFQERAGLAADGVAGPRTLGALNVPARARLGQVLVAMERERWTNTDRGRRHVWVNLADFSAAIVDEGRVTFETRSVIGKDEAGRETPEFSDVMDHMVVNPTWFVPRSIVVGEYLPKLRANPWAASHLTITDSQGRAVDRAAGFSRYTARSFPFAMRQPPGPENALGQVKFMFPNPHNIYLHDTPQKHLFAGDRRAHSHGCVRLAEPAAFAHALLARQVDDPEAHFERLLRSGAETRVNLDEPVPVHLDYRTAFTDAGGALHHREDVYGRDALVLEALVDAGVILPEPQS